MNNKKIVKEICNYIVQRKIHRELKLTARKNNHLVCPVTGRELNVTQWAIVIDNSKKIINDWLEKRDIDKVFRSIKHKESGTDTFSKTYINSLIDFYFKNVKNVVIVDRKAVIKKKLKSNVTKEDLEEVHNFYKKSRGVKHWWEK